MITKGNGSYADPIIVDNLFKQGNKYYLLRSYLGPHIEPGTKDNNILTTTSSGSTLWKPITDLLIKDYGMIGE